MSRKSRFNRLGRKIISKPKEEVTVADFPLYQSILQVVNGGSLTSRLEEFEDLVLTQVVSKLETYHGEIIDAIIVHYHLISPGHTLPKPRCHFGGQGTTYKLADLPRELIEIVKTYILLIIK